MTDWLDRNNRRLDIGDKVTYPRNRTTFDEIYESSTVIGYTSDGDVIVSGSFIDGPRVIKARNCERW